MFQYYNQTDISQVLFQQLRQYKIELQSVVILLIIGLTKNIDSMQISPKPLRFVGLEQGDPGGGGCTNRREFPFWFAPVRSNVT